MLINSVGQEFGQITAKMACPHVEKRYDWRGPDR